MAYVNVCVSGHLKEELVWAIEIWFQVTGNKILFKTVIYTTVKNKVVLSLKEYCMHCYGTAQFKLYTRMQAHACACTFNMCKT